MSRLLSRLRFSAGGAGAPGPTSVPRFLRSSAAGLSDFRINRPRNNNDNNAPAPPASSRGAIAKVPDRQLQKNFASPWIPVADPAGSGQVYYWNKDTNETTHLGSPKPLVWIEEADPNGSDMTYWWSPETGESTQLGAPRPTVHGIQTVEPQQQQMTAFPLRSGFSSSSPPSTFGSTMLQYVLMGFTVSAAFALVKVILR